VKPEDEPLGGRRAAEDPGRRDDQRIILGGGDCIITVKDNQPTLLDAIQT
jgi:hypothetical protein